MKKHLMDEAVIEIAKAKGDKTAAARAMGIPRSTLRTRLDAAAARGLVPREDWAPAVPEGFTLKGVSTLLNAEGDIKAQWYKANRATQDMTAVIDLIHEAFLNFPYRAVASKKVPKDNDEDLLTIYMMGDHHFGMYAWAKETGADYDTEIAWKLLSDTMVELVDRSPKSGTALVLNLGDFFHAENDGARTPGSGNQLDTDTRFAHVLSMGVDLTILCIQQALRAHGKVLYRALPGNHDPYATLALTLGVSKYFANEPRVEVDLDPSAFYYLQFGKCMIGATHGDKLKPVDLPGYMATRWPTIWGDTLFRYGYLGHVHHSAKGGGEKNGVVWETFQTLASKDGWHAGMGYQSHRSMTAITLHRETGERFRTTRSIV